MDNLNLTIIRPASEKKQKLNKNPFHGYQLTERERLILQFVVHNFILTAEPVGSRALSRRYGINLSPATIRNVMADLEDMGLLTHPHTSAGRIPTDFGYRSYVDNLMQIEELPEEIINTISAHIEHSSNEVTNVLDSVSELLSEVTRLLSVITAPDVSVGELSKIELVRLTKGRIMVVIIVKSGLVRTINLELNTEITDPEILEAAHFLNQRLVGLTLTDIPRNILKRLAGEGNRKNAIVRLFMEFPDKIFDLQAKTEMLIGGTRHVLELPEYQSHDRFKGIIELIEDRDVIVHLLKDRERGLSVTIGEENQDDQLKNMSVITSKYRIGDHFGTLGIIGPTRMNYSRLVALVDYTSKLVTERVDFDKSR